MAERNSSVGSGLNALRPEAQPREGDTDGGLLSWFQRAMTDRLNASKIDRATRNARYEDARGNSQAISAQDWINAQSPPQVPQDLIDAARRGGLDTLVPKAGFGTTTAPVPSSGISSMLPPGWNGTMPNQPTRMAERAQALAGGEGEGSILPFTGLPRFITEMGLRLAASNRPDFLGAIGESALGSFGSTEQAMEREQTRDVAKGTAKRQALLAQAQVNQLNASAMEAMDRIGKPRDVKMITTGDGVVAAVQDGNVKIIIDPRTNKPMRGDDPDSLKVLNALIEANFGDMDAISENIGQYTDVIKKFRSAGSTLYEPKESATVKSKPSGPTKTVVEKTKNGHTVRTTVEKQ